MFGVVNFEFSLFCFFYNFYILFLVYCSKSIRRCWKFMDRMTDIYEMMKNVRRISFQAKSLEGSSTGWNYVGKGNVVVREGDDKLYFIEEIILDNDIRYNDRKLWEFKEDCIGFYRFRNGDYEKIFEFLFCNGEFMMKKEYLCSPDLYYGEMKILDNRICLLIKVKGEKKNEVLEYTYLT